MADVAREWSSNFFKDKLVFRKEDQSIRTVASFFDPNLDWCAGVSESFIAPGALSGLLVSWYLLPLNPELARELYEAGVRDSGLRLVDFSVWKILPKFLNCALAMCLQVGLCLAIEFGDELVAGRLRAIFECVGEGREFDHGCFGYFFHLGERWPRGMLSANLIIGDVLQRGGWQRIFHNDRYNARFSAPTVVGVDFPAMGISQAFNDPNTGTLTVSTYVGSFDAAGNRTLFTVTNLPIDATKVSITCDGKVHNGVTYVSPSRINVSTTIAVHTFIIHTGYKGPTGSWPAKVE